MMNQLIKRKSVVFFLFIAFCLPCCTYQIQQKLDAQEQAITLLQKKTHVTDRTLADFQNDTDKLRLEMQSIKGSLEENSHHTKNELNVLRDRIEQLIVSSEKEQKHIEHLQKQFNSTTTKTTKKKSSTLTSSSNEQDFYNQAYSLFKNSKFKNARHLFEKFQKDFPNSQLADNALYWIGNCYFKENSFERAISVFDDVIKKFPQGNKAPDAYYLQALSFYELNDFLSAQLILETLMQNFPSSKAASLARKKYDDLQTKTNP